MADVALVYPPYHFKHPPYPFCRPTLVLAHLYAVLKNAGIGRIEAIDLDLEFDDYRKNIDYFLEEAKERVERLRPKVVCLSCKTAQFPFSALFSRRYKLLHPDARIIMGGWMPTLAPETTLRLSGCDAVVRGEAERSLPELIKRIDDKEWPIEGVSYISPGSEKKVVHNPNSRALTREELDALPLPRYEVLPDIHRYQRASSKLCFSAEASRGCPNHQCIFCWNSTKNCDTSWRAKSPRRVVREMRHLVDEYEVRLVSFTDDNFGADPSWLREFVSLMKAEFSSGEVEYVASTRLDTIDPSMLKDLYRSGLRTAFHGVESGSPSCWKILGKNLDPKITRQYVLDLVRKEVENGIVPICSFIIGFPNETEEDLEETLSFCRKLVDIGSLFSFQILAPNEGTALYEEDSDLIEPFDLYKEFGESENLSPELRVVFGKRLDEFSAFLPDYRWVKPSIPLDRFKEKFALMVDTVSHIPIAPRLRKPPPSFDTHSVEVKELKNRFFSPFKRLLKRRQDKESS